MASDTGFLKPVVRAECGVKHLRCGRGAGDELAHRIGKLHGQDVENLTAPTRPLHAKPVIHNSVTQKRETLLTLLGTGDEPLRKDALDHAALISDVPIRLYPYLRHRIQSRHQLDDVSPEVRGRLDSAVRGSTLATLQRLSALRTACSALEKHDVPVRVLKGTAVGEQVYPNPVLRPMADIDLWVQDLTRATNVMLSTGFVHPKRFYRGTTGADSPVRTFEIPNTSVYVEVHQRLRSFEGAKKERIAELWNSAVEIPFHGLRIWVLRPDDQLLHTVLHATKLHRFRGGLLDLVDVTLLVEKFGCDWDWCAMAADHRQEGVATWMYLTLKLARDKLGAAVPHDYFDAIPEPSELRRLETMASEQMFNATSDLKSAANDFMMATSLKKRARYVYNRFFLHYWKREPGAQIDVLSRTIEAARRVAFDMRVKLPRYAKEVWRGSLRGAELRKRTLLAQERGRLAELVELNEAAMAEVRQSPRH